jgi:hypothetical protein
MAVVGCAGWLIIERPPDGRITNGRKCKNETNCKHFQRSRTMTSSAREERRDQLCRTQPTGRAEQVPRCRHVLNVLFVVCHARFKLKGV